MGIELHYADALLGIRVGNAHHSAVADGMLTAEDEGQATLRCNTTHAFTNAQHDITRLATAIYRRVCINTRATRLASQLVKGFKLVGCLDDGGRAFNRAAAVADGFFVWYGNDVKARAARGRLADF